MYFDGESLDKKFFSKGDEVFHEGDPGDAAYIVENGSVGIFKTIEGEEIHLATMNDGELFGEMAIIDGSERMAHAIALKDSVIVAIPRAGLEALLSKQAPLVKTLIQILVDNLRNVHKIYMKRPRSVIDYFNAISFQTEGLARNIEANQDLDPSGDGLRRLGLIEDQLQVLREQFASFKDRRANVLDQSGEGVDGH
ncbi:MAG: cyclic nucleotide-binding domain-containing protein [Rhodospirillales bacterium]|nr:cyclic nucleotide-binding domain-containing protein [Rhodospirillales bacterium]